MVCSDDLSKKKITKNSLKLPKDSDEVEAEKPRISINEKLINKLRDACNSRSLLAKLVFQGEWTGVLECFVSKECKPYHNAKAAILDCITSDQAYIECQSMLDAFVIDLSVIIRSQTPLLSSGSTFDDFHLLVMYRIIKRAESCNAERVDVVTDQYTELSIKSPTKLARKSKSFGQQILFECETRVPNDVCESILTNEMNKTKLNKFIIWKFVGSNSWKHQYYVINGTKNVITEAGQTSIYDSGVVNSFLGEADNRIVCHISDIISKGYSKIMLHIVDSDVVVILLGLMSEFMAANPSVEITVDFKTSSGRKYISVNFICSNL